MILSHVLSSRFSSAIFLICVFIPLAILIYIYVGTFYDNFNSNNIVIKSKRMMFDEYLIKFNKSYSGDEYFRRLSNFMASLKEISKLNKITGAVHGLTKFSDMSKEEFSRMMIPSRRLNETGDIEKNCLDDEFTDIEDLKFFNNTVHLPVVVDWRSKVGPILNQMQCGACWAFSTVGLVESMALIQDVEKTYTRRSIQELIDCVHYCHGCMGGTVASTLEYLCANNLSITTEEEYPLTLVDQKCRKSPHFDGRRIKQYWVKFDLPEEKMQYLLFKHGPLAVVVNADPWMHYKGGIIQRACFRSKDGYGLDHSVQLVGYDKSGSINYYIVRNSWGSDFGNEGYVKLVMNKNICGIKDEVTGLSVY